MNTRLAILFAAVAEEKSFTRAAARLNIAQPWLSAQIRKFEAQLGFSLFDRHKGTIELTHEAELMLPLSQALARDTQELRVLARSLARGVSLYVRVGANVFSGGSPAFAVLNDGFVAQYSDAKIVIETGDTAQLLEDLASDRLDVVLALSPIDVDGFDTIVLGRTAPYLLMSRGAALARGGSVRPADLAGVPVGAIRRLEHPALYDAIYGPIIAAGAEIRVLPEMGRDAMEHHARSQRTPVLMVEGEPADYRDDPDLVAHPLTDTRAIEHVLVMRTGQEKRAVARYWRDAQRLALPLSDDAAALRSRQPQN